MEKEDALVKTGKMLKIVVVSSKETERKNAWKSPEFMNKGSRKIDE